MADKTEWVVNGFQFGTQQDAELAQNEKVRIERLEEKLDYQNQEMVYAVYKRQSTTAYLERLWGMIFSKGCNGYYMKMRRKTLPISPYTGYTVCVRVQTQRSSGYRQAVNL